MKVPSSRSSRCSFPSRARVTTSERAAAISASVSRSAPRMTGTTSPCGAATATPMFAVGCSRIASSAHCAFTSRWRMSAAAQTFVRTSVTVSFGPPSFSRRRATSVFARVMSAEDWSWKTGICQASVRRRAIVRRTLVSSRRSTSPGTTGVGAGAAAGAVAPASARSTSSATIRPSGPVPRICASSIPRSRAIRRANGDALIRSPSLVGTGPVSWTMDLSASAGRSSFSFGACFSFGCAPLPETATSSPSSPITAIVLPTSTSPSSTAIFRRTPDASASTSWVTLSVSSS